MSEHRPGPARATLGCLCVLALLLLPAAASAQSDEALPEAVTQRLIVKFRSQPAVGVEPESEHDRARVSRLSADRRIPLAYVRPMAVGAHVVELDHPVPLSEARAIAQRLAGHADVEYIQPDRRMRAQFVPNDQYLAQQTYLRDDAAGISAFSAWDLTTGSANVVVAVVDTGYRPHPALAGRILPGYDFISNPLVANDGDGRDADATDPGDWIVISDLTASQRFYGCRIEDSTWHGTSTAGIIAANTNDGAWTAGIDWSARILPVRVLGKCYGDDSDVLDGIAWAAGLPVPGVPANPTPAQVINLSLGQYGECEPAYQQVIASAFAHGVTRAIVAGAGNGRIDVSSFMPANCPGVISVAATNSIGGKASYTNFGPTITISAPGGDTFAGFDGIELLGNLGTEGPTDDSVYIANGTSFSAPMVSGTVALMLAVAPGLSAPQIAALLESSAKPFPPGSTCSTANCGAGIVDAHAAVLAAQAGPPSALNYGGLWWNSPGGSESGWGINFAHEGDQIFASWFTYDLTGKAWWLVMSANLTAPRVYSGSLFQGTGPPFDSVPFPPLGAPGGASGSSAGTGTLRFNDANNGIFTYTVNGITQTKSITRETFGSLPACAFGAQANLAQTSNYQDLWWAAPAGSEAGWGINLVHESDTIFATWYTFDHDRTPMWLVSTLTKAAAGSYSGDLIRLTSGPPFNQMPFPPIGSPGGASGTVVGNATLNFSDGNTGTFSYTIGAVAQSKSITREVLSSPGTVCH
ncbi:MAG TPA: S8 family peptidase [Casimicrobiaceae bacterium]|nr:S8 family peptidase [Casimicrobiaceae bacterium]